MRTIAIILLTAACAGCGPSANETAAGITSFVASCKGPVSGKLVLGNYGNSMELACTEFKPVVKESGK